MQENIQSRRSLESSLALLARAKAGDSAALEALLARYRPRLTRWAHRRLPAWARDLADTEDLVQETLAKTIRSFDRFVAGDAGGFQNYLRLAVRNAILDQIRRARRHPAVVPLDPALPSHDPSPLEHTIGRERLARYEAALARLTSDEREAVVARFEFGFTHVELAAALGKSTPDAARKLCVKATNRLLTFMREPLESQGT